MLPNCNQCNKKQAVIQGLCSTCGFGLLYGGILPRASGKFTCTYGDKESVEDSIKTLLRQYPGGLNFKEILNRVIPLSKNQQPARTALWVGIDLGIFKMDRNNVVQLASAKPSRIQSLLSFWRNRK